MRRVTRKSEKERGAAGVLVAVMMVVLLGAGAMAVDVGQIYAERAQLQNAADAAAMATAQQCHNTPADCPIQALPWAQEMTAGNSNDGATAVDSVDLTVPNQVTVATSTLNGTSGAGFLTQLFANALNAPPVTVGARATAVIEPLGGATAFPLAISDCQYDLSGAEETGEVQLIKYKPGSGTCTSTSGHVIPGGFGWLDDSGTCVATTDAGDIADTDTGANFPGSCTAIVTGWRNTILAGGSVEATFPVYDDAGGTGHGGWFHIRGYATFKIIGWAFSGGGTPEVFRETMPWVGSPANACTGSCRGIIGQFIRFESIGEAGGTPGTGPDLGTVNIRLIR
ncbi:pilus assembly protein TadG-related protein [Arthrobacter sp. Hor0625]|uniref:pilus assembly protein TadG-related protein n=1 Tax=Arthrobacter sp. Hor0625 TaxID=3457358 RepID=UPI00403EE9BA